MLTEALKPVNLNLLIGVERARSGSEEPPNSSESPNNKQVRERVLLTLTLKKRWTLLLRNNNEHDPSGQTERSKN